MQGYRNRADASNNAKGGCWDDPVQVKFQCKEVDGGGAVSGKKC